MFGSLRKIWSSSASAPPPTPAPVQPATEGDIVNGEEGNDQSLVDPRSPRSPNSGIYEDALEDIKNKGVAAEAGDSQHNDRQEASTGKVKTKKSKTSKKAKQVEEAIAEENGQDTEMLDVDSANATSQIQKTVNGTVAKKGERLKGSKNSLNKSDLKLLRQNKENGIVGDGENTSSPMNRSKKKNAAKVQKRQLSPVQPEFDDNDEIDDSALLREQLSPAKPTLPLHDIALEPDVEVNAAEPEAMDIDSAPATVTKKRKKKVTLALQGEESTKKKMKKSKASEEKEQNNHSREIMDSQPELPPTSTNIESSRLEELARNSYLQFAEENASPPPKPNSIEVIIPRSSSSQNVERPIFASQLAAKVSNQSQPRVSRRRSSGWAAINVRDSSESVLEPERAPAPLHLQEEPDVQQAIVQHPVIEEEPKALTRKSSARKRKPQKEVSPQPDMEQETDEPEMQPEPKSVTKKSSSQRKKARKEALVQPDMEQQIEEPEVQREARSLAKMHSKRKKEAQEEVDAQAQDEEEVLVPLPKSSSRKKRGQNEPLAQPEIEKEAIEEFPSATPKSSTRKRRRLPVDSEELAEASGSQPASSKAARNTKTDTQAPLAAIVTSPVPPTKKGSKYGTGRQKGVRLTQAHIQKISNAVEVYREMQGLEAADMIAYIHQDIKEESKDPNTFWKYVHNEVPDLTRRKVVAYCRRNFHNFKRGPWTEEEDQEMETIINTIDNTTGLSQASMWKTVGDLLNRYNEDCRDRWRTYCACKDRKAGPWDLEEEAKLRNVVREVQETAYNIYRQTGESTLLLEDFEPDYTLVSKKMGTRTRLQCMNKWKSILDRENEDGDDPRAEAPVSKSAWRQVPALEAALALSADEKYNILSLVRASGAAREGKVPWATFPNSKGNVMIWRTFVRGAMYTISNYEEMSFQERIEYLFAKFESNEPVEIDEQAEEFLRMVDYKSRSGKWKLGQDSNLSSRFVEDDEDDEDEQETGADILEMNLRRRMKKQGESQDTNAAEEESSTAHQQEVAGVMDEIRDSHKKRKITASNVLERELDEDQDEEPQSTPSGKEKRPYSSKKAKKSTIFEQTSADQDADAAISSQSLAQTQNKEGESEAPDPALAPKKDKKRQSKKTKPIEGEGVEEAVNGTADQEQDQDPVEVNPDVIDASTSLKPKKSKKSKKSRKSISDEDLRQIHEEIALAEAMSASASPEKPKKNKSKKDRVIERPAVPEENSELINGQDEYAAENADDYDYEDPFRSTASQVPEKKKKKSKIVQSFEEEAGDELFDKDQGMSNNYDQEATVNEVPSVADDLEDPNDPIEYTPESDDPVAQFSDEVQYEGLHDQESLDLDNTGTAMPADHEEDYENAYDNLVDSYNANPSRPNNDNNSIYDEIIDDIVDEDVVDDIPNGDYLDEEHTITTNGFRTQASPELGDTTREADETPITYPRLPTPPSAQPPRTSDKASKKDKKRKRLSSQAEQPASNEVAGGGEKKPKKKRKVDVREAQAKWERLQPREYFGLEADEESDYGSGQKASLSEDSDGSDTSIPARVPPKNSKATKVGRAKRGRMQ